MSTMGSKFLADLPAMEQALEAYNLIREYCAGCPDCGDCLFVDEHGKFCIFDSFNANAESVPAKWLELDLD